MKFLIDMPLSPELANWLNQQGHDAVHASKVGLDRASDTEILERARSERRVVITADLDYPRLLALAQAEGPGVILFRGGNYSEQESLNRLKRTLETIPIEELTDSIVVVEKERIRRRRLPLEPSLE
jgi:predicted nuclease of predicted toxin-antitoxin system